MKNPWRKNYLSFVLLLYLSGCGAIDHHLRTGEEAFDRIRTTRVEYDNRFVGKSKEIVLVELGKPSYVRQNVFYSRKEYSEEWVYKIKRTFWEGNIPQAVGLYFDGDRIAVVEVW